MVIALTKSIASRVAISAILLAFFPAWSAVSVEQQSPQRRPGVMIGHMVEYGDFLAQWNSDDPSLKVPQNFLDTNNTLTIRNMVQNISGSTIILETQTRYKNGSEQRSTTQINVVTGVGGGNLSIVSADLSAGDRVYTTGELYDARINTTISRAYAGLTRRTNLLNMTHVVSDVNATTGIVSSLFWDKATGVLVEQMLSFARIDANGYLTDYMIQYKMTNNNIWLGPGIEDEIPPAAEAGANRIVELGESVSFDASDSEDNVGIASFLWDFGDDSTDSSMQTSHIYATAGVFNVTLTVRDAKGNTARDSVSVSVVEPPPSQQTSLLLAVLFIAALLLVAWFFFRRR